MSGQTSTLVSAFGSGWVLAALAVGALATLGCNSCSSPPEAKDPEVAVSAAPTAGAAPVDPAKVERVSGGCVIGGCAGERCDPPEMPQMATACMQKPEWDCYKEAQCGRDPQNQCGWVMTPELEKCLAVSGKEGSSVH
jgi:hypothetical protein